MLNDDTTTTYVRAPRPHGGFTTVFNDVVRNPELSFKALGILTYLLSHSDGWHFSAERIAALRARDKRDGIRSGFKELEQAGHLVRQRFQQKDGRWITRVTVFDLPRAELSTGGAPRYPQASTGGVSAGHTDDGFPGVGSSGVGSSGVGEAVVFRRPLQEDTNELGGESHHARAREDDEPIRDYLARVAR